VKITVGVVLLATGMLALQVGCHCCPTYSSHECGKGKCEPELAETVPMMDDKVADVAEPAMEADDLLPPVVVAPEAPEE
jgi:hypothetical protein